MKTVRIFSTSVTSYGYYDRGNQKVNISKFYYLTGGVLGAFVHDSKSVFYFTVHIITRPITQIYGATSHVSDKISN